MVPLEPIPVQPKAPDPARIDPGQVVIAYDRRVDTLVVDFFGRERPSKVLHTGTGVDLRVDPATEVIVGLQIEAVRRQAVDRHPLPILLIANLAELLGIRDDDLREIRNRIAHPRATPRRATRRQGTLASLDERRRKAIASLIKEALPMSA
jgi:hypothetical protein